MRSGKAGVGKVGEASGRSGAALQRESSNMAGSFIKGQH